MFVFINVNCHQTLNARVVFYTCIYFKGTKCNHSKARDSVKKCLKKGTRREPNNFEVSCLHGRGVKHSKILFRTEEGSTLRTFRQ